MIIAVVHEFVLKDHITGHRCHPYLVTDTCVIYQNMVSLLPLVVYDIDESNI